MADFPPKKQNRLFLILIKPTWTKILIFLLFVFFMPVFHLRTEPLTQICNTPRQWKYQTYESLAVDVFGGYTENLDVFMGVVSRNYFVNNIIGIPLLILYYGIACLFCAWLTRIPVFANN